jgi:hypothetical protein
MCICITGTKCNRTAPFASEKKTVVHKLSNNADHEITEFVNWYLQGLHVGKFISTLILFSDYTYSDLTWVRAQ